MQTIATMKELIELNELVFKMNNLNRWSDFKQCDVYNELNKQAFNCIIAFELANFVEKQGRSVNWVCFPRIAISRAFAKVYVYYDTPEHKISFSAKIGNIGKDKFDDVTREYIAVKTSEKFASFLCDNNSAFEEAIYKAASKIATYIELLEYEKIVQNQALISQKKEEIMNEICEYMYIPGVREFIDQNSQIFKLFQFVSSLRNKLRWATCCKAVKCSVLGHLFDTAIWAYLIGLEQSSFDEQLATKFFFMGIFHDIAETWTHDIPSPIKDKIEGYRAATEEHESQMLEEHMYPNLVTLGLDEPTRNIMFEDKVNRKYRKFIKIADYLSADSECWRNLVAGSRYYYYWDAIIERKIDKSSKINTVMHAYLAKYAKKARRRWR